MGLRSAPQLKSSAEINKLRAANLIVAEVLDEVGAMVAPGVSTWDLELRAREILKQHDAKSAFMGYTPGGGVPPFPAVLCTSKNEVIVHGIPRPEAVLTEGDILSVDFGCFKDGWCGDSARTFAVGRISEEAAKLMAATEEGLAKAIEQLVVGNRLGDVSSAVQQHVEAQGFSVVRQFVGHGIGRSMHEPPLLTLKYLTTAGLRSQETARCPPISSTPWS
jgi:methionyl aminopeptidase